MRRLMLAMLVAGCAGGQAHWVTNPGAADPYGPVTNGAGSIRYWDAGINRAANRQAAYKGMWQACGGSYRIDDEGNYGRNPHEREIRFTCVPPQAPAVARAQ